MTTRPYLLVAAALMGVYVLACVAMFATKDFDDRGPLSLIEPALEGSLPGAISAIDAAGRCFPKTDRDTVKVVGGLVQGRPYYACYHLDSDDGSVIEAKVVDGQGFAVNNAGLVKDSGAWPWVATVDNAIDLTFGAMGLAVLLWIGWIYGRRARPAGPAAAWWAQPWVLVVLALIPFLGWLALAGLPRVEGSRKARAALHAFFIFTGLILFGLLSDSATVGDTWGMVVNALLAAGLVWAVAGSRTLRPVVVASSPPPSRAGRWRRTSKIVDRSSPAGEMHEDPAAEPTDPEAERVPTEAPEPERQRQPEPPRG